MEVFLDQFETLPQYLSAHLLLVSVALLAGITISIPLGVFASRRKKIEDLILGTAGIIQTIPSLALLALMVPLLGGAIGRLPAFIALSLYSILPMIRNTVTGLTEVDRGLIEASKGMGMTSSQMLRRVELPLALPVIIAGIRTSTVWVVGTATLATPVGADCLGYYIFLGLNTRQTAITLFGCIFAALLAIVLDKLIDTVQNSVQKKARLPLVFASTALAAISLCGLLSPLAEQQGYKAEGATSGTAANELVAKDEDGLPLEGKTFVIGSKQFTESYILAELLALHVSSYGGNVQMKTGLGSKILFDALAQDSVDVYVDYSGTIWATVMERTDTLVSHKMNVKVSAHLLENYGVVNLGSLGFENAYAFAMRRSRARELGIVSIEDLASLSEKLSIAGDFDFFGRPEGKYVLETYGLKFGRRINMNSRLMYDAVDGGTVDVITAYSSDGQILAFDLWVLEDPKAALPPYDAVLLVSPQGAQEPHFMAVLSELINAIKDEDMRWANKSVDIDQRPIGEVALELYRRVELRMKLSRESEG